jgi:GT2 family glycosyltransferase
MRESVAVVVVTFNRAALLLDCLAALLRQTSPLDKIILVDNASSDGTPEILATHGYRDHPAIDYVRLTENTGGAGGFHEGMKRGYDMGFHWLWVMDDDAEPQADALERIRESFARPGIGGVASLVMNRTGKPDVAHRGWLDVCGSTTRAHRTIDVATLSEEPTEISFASFVGLAVSRTAVERIGLPRKEFFIHCDDLEYCTRLAALGPIVLVPRSRILHKDQATVDVRPGGFLGRKSIRVPLHKLWLSYFSMRNLMWLRRQHCGALVAGSFALRQYPRTALGILLYDTDRWLRLKFFMHLFLDGWRGVFDNAKPKRLTQARTGPSLLVQPGTSPLRRRP